MPRSAAVGRQLTALGNLLFYSGFKWVVIFAPLALVLFLSFRVHRMSVAAAQLTFWIYAALVGVSFASLGLVYTGQSIGRVFFITAASFGGLATNTVTFTAWIRPLGNQLNWAGILMTRGGGIEGGMGYNDQQMLAYTWNNNTTWNFVSGLVVPTNQWSFVAMVIEPTQATLHLCNTNGHHSATNAIAHTADVFANNWRIGDDGNDPLLPAARTFNGLAPSRREARSPV